MKQICNPYLPSCEYIPDGEPHVFNGRLYLYGSHDRFDSSGFCLNDYVCWSAPADDLRPLASSFDKIWTGHGPEALPAAHLENVIALLDKILQEPFGVPNPPDEPPGLIADGEGCRITYRMEKI